MNPEEKRQVKQIQDELRQLQEQFRTLQAASTIPFNVSAAISDRFNLHKIRLAPLASITSPSGGGVIDANARTAIDTIITRLEDLNLVKPN